MTRQQCSRPTRPNHPIIRGLDQRGDQRARRWRRLRWGQAAAAFALLLLAAAPLAAQRGTVTGVVRDETGALLEATEVRIVGTNLRALTNESGRFLIPGVPSGRHTIEASRLGYHTARLQVEVGEGTTTVDFELRYTALALDELVVTGQGSEISRRRLSTNVEVISSTAIESAPVSRLDQLLQAQLPTAQVRMTSGQPGATSLIRARGPVSVSRSSTPVIYVDGVRVDNLNTRAELSLSVSGPAHQGTQTSAIADIPLENIERIEYIPGGAATTLYGSDAANGVIQIFTKKGVPGQAQFTVETELGIENVDSKYFFFPRTAELLYRNGRTQTYRLAGNGGTEDMTWSFSGSVQDRAGYRIGNNASRTYQARTGLTANIAPRLRYDASFAFGWNHYERTRDGNAGGYTPLWLLEGGRIFALGFSNNLNEMSAEELERLRAFLKRAEQLQDYRIQVARFQMSHAMRWQPREDLSFRALVGIDSRNSNERGIVTNEFLVHTGAAAPGTDDRGTIDSYDRRFLGLTLEAAGQHQWNRGSLSVVTNVGAQLFRDQDEQAARIARNVRDGAETVRGAGQTEADDFFLTVVNYGAYIQQNWGFFDRYFIEVGLRADGNSAFGDQVGFQFYPKAGLVYDLGAEPFYRDGPLSRWIGAIRLRANYGVAGNFPAPFANDRTIAFASYLGQQSAAFGQPGNPDLGPEKTATVELGTDLEALDGRLSLRATWYDARTRDALFPVPLAPSLGQGTQLRNVGEIQNRGMELAVSADLIRRRNLGVRFTASLNTLHNEVVDDGGSPIFSIGGFSSSTIETVVEKGKPVGYLRGSKAILNPDGTLNRVETLQYIGKPLPDRFGTLGLDVTVGPRLRFNASADWQTGAQLHSFNRQFRYLYGLDDPKLPRPLLELDRTSNWLNLTSLFVEDTDYLIVRNVSVSYTLPEHLTTGFAKGIEIGLAAHKPFGWWKSSFDPESDHSGARTQGGASVGGFNYASDPAPRMFLFNLRARF